MPHCRIGAGHAAEPDHHAQRLCLAPGAIALKANTPVHLHLVDDAAKAHSFSAPEFFAAAMPVPQEVATVRHGMIDLEGHQSLDLTVTPLQPGTYALGCSHSCMPRWA